MRLSWHDMVRPVADAVASYIAKDGEPILYQHYTPTMKNSGAAPKPVLRRPNDLDFKVRAFPQTFSHGSTLYGGMGIASYVDQYVVVIEGHDRAFYVYAGVGGRLAYTVKYDSNAPELYEKFLMDMAKCAVANKKDAVTRYGAVSAKDQWD